MSADNNQSNVAMCGGVVTAGEKRGALVEWWRRTAPPRRQSPVLAAIGAPSATCWAYRPGVTGCVPPAEYFD
jgi:hypothetical protein